MAVKSGAIRECGKLLQHCLERNLLVFSTQRNTRHVVFGAVITVASYSLLDRHGKGPFSL